MWFCFSLVAVLQRPELEPAPAKPLRRHGEDVPAGTMPSFVWHSQALSMLFHSSRTMPQREPCARLFLSVLLVDRVLKGAEEDWAFGTTESYSEWLFHSRPGLSYSDTPAAKPCNTRSFFMGAPKRSRCIDCPGTLAMFLRANGIFTSLK